jgi:hypothetical protein
MALVALGVGLWLAPRIVVAAAENLSVDQMKAKVAVTKLSDRPPLCLRISEKQLDAANAAYTAGDSEKAKAALNDVAAFAELARDYSVQTHKHEKQSEIEVRKMVRKLADLKHEVTFQDQQAIQETIDDLQRVRDDLLKAMFPKVGNKK